MIKQFVVIYDNTIRVRIVAIWLDSLSVLPAFSPSAFAQSLHMFFILHRMLIQSYKYAQDAQCAHMHAKDLCQWLQHRDL